MKKAIVVFVMILSLSFSLCGCFQRPMVIPNNDSIGDSEVFEKDGIKLTLTDRFIEKESELGFYAYYVSDFCGVVVLKEEFSLEAGLAERSVEQYVKNVITNNGHTDIEPQNRDGLWYYIKDSDSTRSYSYSFKGSDAFWIVQYICMTSDAPMYEDLFFLWAKGVEVE